MVYLSKKEKKGQIYLYLQESARINGKVRRVWQKYLGPETKIKDIATLASGTKFVTETKEFGLLMALTSIAEKLELVPIIDLFVEKRNQGLSVGEHVLLAALNRCVEPSSKSELESWIKKTVLNVQYGHLPVNLDSTAYWAHYRYLTSQHLEEIGDELARAVRRRFGVQYTNMIYDPTNFYTYINPTRENQTLAEHGHSKENRATLNIINFSLFCALDGGIPLLHTVYPGNIPDVSRFKTSLIRLQSHLKKVEQSPTTITLTFDKGNLSEKAFEEIDTMQMHYITSIRPSTQKDILGLQPADFTMHTLPNGKNIGVNDFRREIYGKMRRVIAVYNPLQAKWQLGNLETKIANKLQKITQFFATRLNTSRWTLKGKIMAKCLKLIGAKKFRSLITIQLSKEQGLWHLQAVRDPVSFEKIKNQLGKSFLMSDRDDLPASELVWTYRQQYMIEEDFKTLKNAHIISIRPTYCWIDSSLQGHAFTCYIGLLLLRLLIRKLQQNNIHMSVPHMVKVLNNIKITQIHIPGRQKPILSLNKCSGEEQQLLELLNLEQAFNKLNKSNKDVDDEQEK